MIAEWEARRAPIRAQPGDVALPPHDADLAALAAARMPKEAGPLTLPMSRYGRKYHALAVEFSGAPALAFWNAMLIASLRRTAWPKDAPVLFRRIWAEESGVMIGMLDTRWLIASVITFADHGVTEGERSLGQSIKMMFKLIKLYEYERLYSGHRAAQAFRFGNRARGNLPMEINPFSIREGGLDVNLLAPLWVQARAEPVMGPLACHLFDRLNRDPRTIFRRVAVMRARILARDARVRAQTGDAQVAE